MSRATVILGKSGVGKTFVAAHLAMAFSYLGEKTLLVGCDQKRDTARAVTAEHKPALIEALEAVGFEQSRLSPAALVVAVTPYLDAVELGASPLIVGNYADVLEASLRTFETLGMLLQYQQVIYDLGDDRFDAAAAPLFRRADHALAVSDDSPESLFVLNRLLRAALIGGYEFECSLRIVGAVNARSLNPQAFDRYVERTRCLPLLCIPEADELAGLRRASRTLFALPKPTPQQDQLIDGFIRIAELLRGRSFNLYPVTPLPDQDVWGLAPAVTLTN
ncbi:MAG: hypothetical protein HY423_14135 [Candidatus Lambdaproteobacteria bacterium]|nr:hypothetical protein [Candidatus Lambdaproteobacteria bacterium]